MLPRIHKVGILGCLCRAGWSLWSLPAEDIPGFFIIHQSRLVCLLLSRGRRNVHLRAPSPPGVNFWGNPSLYEQGLPFLAPTGCPQVKLCRALSRIQCWWGQGLVELPGKAEVVSPHQI